MTSWKFYDNNADRLFADYISLDFTLSFRMLKSLFYNLRVSLWMSVQVPAVMLLR